VQVDVFPVVAIAIIIIEAVAQEQVIATYSKIQPHIIVHKI
jgi:hypothetical protein